MQTTSSLGVRITTVHSSQSGYSSRQINAGLIRNRGIEVSLGGQIIKTKDWQWNLDVNFAHNENKLVRLNESMTKYNLYASKFYYYWRIRAEEGQPIGVISTEYRWARNDDGKLIVKPTTSKAWGGGYMPTYDKSDKDLGNYQPDLTGGFSTTLRWKALTLGMSFDFMIGGQIVSWTNMWGTGSGILAESSKINNRGVNEREAIVNNGGVFVDAVNADGEPVQCYMNAYNYYHYLAYYDLDNWVYDRTYLKMREISLGFNLPKKYIGMINKYNLGLSSLSLSFVASNPWLIYSACPNIDPSEASSSSVSSSYIEGGQAPATRTFGFTVKLGF